MFLLTSHNFVWRSSIQLTKVHGIDNLKNCLIEKIWEETARLLQMWRFQIKVLKEFINSRQSILGLGFMGRIQYAKFRQDPFLNFGYSSKNFENLLPDEEQPLPKWKKFLVSLIVVLVIAAPIALILYFTVFTAPAPGNGGGGFSFSG